MPAATPVLVSSKLSVIFCVPSNDTELASTSPVTPIVRAVNNCVALLALPYKSALTTVAEKLPALSRFTITLAVLALVASSTRST